MVTRAKPGQVQLPPLVVEQALADEIERAWHQLMYPNRAEFLRDALRAGAESLLKAQKKAP